MSATEKATRGPWRVVHAGDFLQVWAPDGRPICDLGLVPNEDWAQQDRIEVEATVALIASAPDLLAALQEVVAVFDSPKMQALWGECLGLLGSYDGPSVDVDNIRALIARATATQSA